MVGLMGKLSILPEEAGRMGILESPSPGQPHSSGDPRTKHPMSLNGTEMVSHKGILGEAERADRFLLMHSNK